MHPPIHCCMHPKQKQGNHHQTHFSYMDSCLWNSPEILHRQWRCACQQWISRNGRPSRYNRTHHSCWIPMEQRGCWENKKNTSPDLALVWALNEKNSLQNVAGFSPTQLVLGTSPKLPTTFCYHENVIKAIIFICNFLWYWCCWSCVYGYLVSS